MTKEIELTQGKIALVDDDDFERLNQHKWHYFGLGYAARHGSKQKGSKEINYILMHREIMNFPEKTGVDHKNHNGIDNRKENLRICGQDKNLMNTRIRSDNKSGFKGVSWNKEKNKWVVHIRINCKTIHVGYYSDKRKAAMAYNEAAKRYFGEFACINNIQEITEPPFHKSYDTKGNEIDA